MKKHKFSLNINNIGRLIAHDTKLTHKKGIEITTSIMGIIGYNLIQNKEVTIPELGKLKVIKPKLKTANHIIENKVRTFQPKNKIIFKPLKSLKLKLNPKPNNQID